MDSRGRIHELPVDLAELDRLHAAAALEMDGGESIDASLRFTQRVRKEYPALSAELRKSRARVAELEERHRSDIDHVGKLQLESAEGWGKYRAEKVERRAAVERAESAEARVKELETRLASLACPMPGCDGDIGCVLHGTGARVKELEAAANAWNREINAALDQRADRIYELASRVKELEAENAPTAELLRRVVEAIDKVPLIRLGEPGTNAWLTCIGCERDGSDNCKPDCWVLRLEGVSIDATAWLELKQEGGSDGI